MNEVDKLFWIYLSVLFLAILNFISAISNLTDCGKWQFFIACMKSGSLYLSKNNGDLITNLATGEGYSVLEIINRFEDLISIKINYDIVNKREGDLATMVALSKIAYDKLGWEPRFSDIDTILNSMWNIYKEF